MEKENQLQVISKNEIEILVESGIIPKGTPKEQISVFARVCGEKNLSPFSRQIYLIPRKSNSGIKYTIQTGIDGFRALADRTGAYAGNDDYLFDEGLTQFQMIKDKRKQPTIATATVYKVVHGLRVSFTASAEWSAYYPGEQLGFMWKKMPFLMLGKCAESLAMRKAFPETLSGIYTDEEMQQAGNIETIKIETVNAEPEQPVRDIQAEINACKDVTELNTLYRSLTKELKTEHLEKFTVKKTEFLNSKINSNGKD